MNNRFVIVIGSRNNSQWVKSNINSVLSQDYENYKVLYFDDASEDNTADQVKKMVKNDKRFEVYDLYKERKYKTWYFAHIEPENDNDILVFLDGDDMFASENVLSYLNEVYNQTGCWLTYGGMRVWNGGEELEEPFPQNSEIPDEVKKTKTYRKDAWRTSHLKTMRGFLWKSLDKKDLCPDGKYMVGPDDLAIMFGVLELCPANKIYRVTDPLYIYNHTEANQRSRAFTDHKTSNIDYETIVRSRKPYDTISFVTPTLAGGLGNQMFEIAAAASLAKDNGAVLIVNPQEHILPNQGRNVNNYRDNIFSKIMFDSTIQPENEHRRDVCTYAPIPYKKNMKLHGHYQSWKYFDHNREYIQKLFYQSNLYQSDITALHIRRGDYYKFPDHHPQLPLQYFVDALKQCSPETVMVFTDDPEWCEKNVFPILKDLGIDRISMGVGGNDNADMEVMSKCKNLIISNSSFGWWGAYLNNTPNKKIYVPSVWFGRAMVSEGFNIDDLLLPDWIKVPTSC